VTNRNRIEIVNSEETKPGVFIGSCLVEPEEYTCPIRIINTTEESVEITTSLVTVDELQCVTAQAYSHCNKPRARITNRYKNEKKIYANSLEHLNREEKKAVEEICEDFCDILHLEQDT